MSRTLLRLPILGVALLAAGCGSPETPKALYCTTPDCNSANGVSQNFQLALANRDLAELDSLLAPDFVANIPGGLAGDTPDSISRTEFLSWFSREFHNPAVSAVRLHFDRSGIGIEDGLTSETVQSGYLSVDFGTGNSLRESLVLHERFSGLTGAWKLSHWRADSSRTSAVDCGSPGCRNWAWAISQISRTFTSKSAADYSALLDSGYVFRFIPDPLGHTDSLLAPQEAAFARHLFETGSSDGTQPPAASISLTIDTTSSYPDTRLGHIGWIRVYVQTNLVVRLPDGNQTPVSSPAYFFFRLSSSGEWKLAEWQDIQTSSSPQIPDSNPLRILPARVLTWGTLRKLYR